jgi:hypothetical protein
VSTSVQIAAQIAELVKQKEEAERVEKAEADRKAAEAAVALPAPMDALPSVAEGMRKGAGTTKHTDAEGRPVRTTTSEDARLPDAEAAEYRAIFGPLFNVFCDAGFNAVAAALGCKKSKQFRKLAGRKLFHALQSAAGKTGITKKQAEKLRPILQGIRRRAKAAA